MTAPFNRAFENEVKMPVASIRTLLEICCERKQTGIIRFISTEGQSLYMFLKNGIMINAYAISRTAWKSVGMNQCIAWIDSINTAHAKFIRLSPQSLLICKLLIQNTTGKIGTLIGPADIGEYLEAHKKVSDISLVQLEWDNSMGAVLFPGSSEPPYSLFVSSEALYDQPDIAPFILDPELPRCTVSAFGIDQSLEAWQEYLLRRAFADICEHTISKFQMLTGRSLVDSIIRLFIAFATRRRLDIGIPSRKVVDSEIFSSPQQAADSYRLLLTEMFVHFTGIMGVRLLSSTLRELITELPSEERAVITTFSLFPEGFIYEPKV